MAGSGILIDVDNTLYASSFDTEPLFVARIIEFIQKKLGVSREKALELHNDWQKQCTSDLVGIVKDFKVSPKEFMDYICAIDVSFLRPDKKLREELDALPLKKYIYTDSSVGHAEDVCTRLEVSDCFSGYFSSQEGGFTCKRQQESIDRVLNYFDLAADKTWLIDDLPEAVENAKRRGLKTIQIGGEETDLKADYMAADIHQALSFIR